MNNKIYIVVIGILIFVSLELLFPKEKILSRKKIKRAIKNVFFWLLNIGITPIIILPITIAATQIKIYQLFYFNNEIITFLFNLIIVDLFLYWWHRANHEIPLLWRFHQIHHLDETLDVTSAVRFHFGEVILSALVRFLLIIIFSISLINLLLIEAIILICSIFHHSNISIPKKIENFISFIIVTPSIHWVHHHKRQKETDSNYSTIFSWWDKIFRSRSFFKRKLRMPIGVEGKKDQTIKKLILKPFIK